MHNPAESEGVVVPGLGATVFAMRESGEKDAVDKRHYRAATYKKDAAISRFLKPVMRGKA